MSRDIDELFQLYYKLIATKKRSNYTNVNIFFKKQTFSESSYRIITLCLTWQRFKILVLLEFFFQQVVRKATTCSYLSCGFFLVQVEKL